MTLLEIVQSVLNSMDSDSVNDIADTVESRQVSEVAKEVYYELMSYNDWDHLYKWMELESVSDLTRPNYLRIPDAVGRLDYLKYEVTRPEDTRRVISELCYKSVKDFISIVHNRVSTDSNIQTVTNENGVEMFIFNDRPPTYWTSFDNTHVVTDAYNSLQDNTMIGSKSSAWCRVSPVWVPNNLFTPDIPTEFFPAYLAEVKSTCHLYFKQQVSEKDEQKARRGLAHVRRKERFDREHNWVSYGRR
jgi:hypothetical protein